MANENRFETLISQELTVEEQAAIAGGGDLDFDFANSLLGNAIKIDKKDIDLDLDLTLIKDSFNFGKNSVE